MALGDRRDLAPANGPLVRAMRRAQLIALAGLWLSLSFGGGCKSDKPTTGTKSDQSTDVNTTTPAQSPAQSPAQLTERETPAYERKDLHGPTTALGTKPLLMRYDANGNGRLDPDEIATMERERLARVLDKLDRNGDGVLARVEVEEVGPGLGKLVSQWERIDVDKDGSLNVDELAAALKSQKKAAPAPPAKTPPKRDEAPNAPQ